MRQVMLSPGKLVTMRRTLLMLALTTAALTGCGNKGPLSLPATRPHAAAVAPASPASAMLQPGGQH